MSTAVGIRPYRRHALVIAGCLFWGMCLAGAWDLFGGHPLGFYLNAYLLPLFGLPVVMVVLTLLCGWSAARVPHPYVIFWSATMIAVFVALYWLLLFAGNSV